MTSSAVGPNKQIPPRINIVSPDALPTSFSGFCISATVHVMDRYNSGQVGEIPSAKELFEDATAHFGDDFDSGKGVNDDWLTQFLAESGRYEPRLFLETLYLAVFQADFTMQCSDDKDLYLPVRNDCIMAIDAFLSDGLGYGKRVNDINEALAERTALYGQDIPDAPLLFAAHILKLIPSAEVYALRANAYFSLATMKTLIPIFMNRSEGEKEICIRCRRCGKPIVQRVERTPVTIQCRGCEQEYVVDGVWAAT